MMAVGQATGSSAPLPEPRLCDRESGRVAALRLVFDRLYGMPFELLSWDPSLLYDVATFLAAQLNRYTS